jgi:DNA-directed RNA polymerase subunit RPC12/RpoP
MGRDFKVIHLADEFGQYLLVLKCQSCGHERSAYPAALAQFCGWDITLENVEKRLRCSKCGARACRLRAVPMQKPRGTPPSH